MMEDSGEEKVHMAKVPGGIGVIDTRKVAGKLTYPKVSNPRKCHQEIAMKVA